MPLEAATHRITWLLGHKNLDFFEEAAYSFKQAVEKGSGGEIAVDIVAQADDDHRHGPQQRPEIADAVAKGQAEMGHSFVDVMGGLEPSLRAFEAPYLFRGYPHLEGVFEGPLGDRLLDGLRRHGIVGLSFTYSGGANGLATLEREVRRPGDVKGLRIGVFGDEVNAAWISSLGATAVPIGHQRDKIRPLLEDGSIDAVVVTWRNFEQAKLQADFQYMNLMESTYLVSVTYINQKFFDGLSEKHRALILEASREAGRIERAKTIALNEQARRDMAGKGVRTVHLTTDNRRRFSQALEPAYEGAIERIVGKELLRRIRETGDTPVHPAVNAPLARL